MSLERFNRLAVIYSDITFGAQSREGDLTIKNDDQLQSLKSLLAEPREYALFLLPERPTDALKVGETIRLRADDPRTGIGLLADEFDDVLNFPQGRIREPRFYLIPVAWASTGNAPPDQVQRYRHVLSLVKLLEECSAYLDKENQELVFIDDGKFIIPVTFSSRDLPKLDIASLQVLITRFGEDTHREQKITILAKSVQRICGAKPPQQRFADLLDRIPEVLKQFDEGYRLFVADFSYDKVLDQMETAKLEELAKIHKTFADVQNQILGIPVATIIVATQLKETDAINAIFWVNTAVLVGVWVFVVLTWLVMRNQLHTLDALDNEIQRKKVKIEKEYAPIRDVVGSIFPQLEARLRTQRCAFRTVDVVVTIGLILAHIMYFLLTDPAQSAFTQVAGPVLSHFVDFWQTTWHCLRQ
ncbi:hypothetical protein [Pseudomonas aeruginosa]|uniref:hypothetical protein n=1 Tax=Pseudomonas aeruginosa TaxID=287 RepID=UPI000F841C64|nr:MULTISPECIES: hypothetical protein [Pseudomonas]MDH0960591.1 hypothetical protein [Pseudomonas chengduensis]HBO4731536.1 hypothetical protein [Pseudomonas aeruginosa]